MSRVAAQLLLATVYCFVLIPLSSVMLSAQESPDDRFVFEEDARNAKRAQDKKIEQITAADAPLDEDLDFEAPEVEYMQETKKMRGSGGVLVSRGNVQLQADTAEADLVTKDVELSGDVVFTWPEGEVVADSASLNMDSEIGKFSDATIETVQGNYKVSAAELYKDSDKDFRVFDTQFTTCYCEDESVPWSIECSRATIEDDAYAHTYHTTFRVAGVPIIYTPYFLVPVKRTRQSGFLAPTYGYSNQDGFQFELPYYAVIDDYSDLLLRPFTSARTRTGTAVGYRRRFSRTSDLDSRIYYSNESARDGDLRGTNIDNLFDPTFDEDRFGGFLRYGWSSPTDAAVPTRISSDIRYVSDDLFLREIPDIDIGDRSDRYTTSQVLVQSAVAGNIFAELSGEFNQSLQTDDDLIFQRLPQLSVSTRESFRPFGFNPYGVKVVGGVRLDAVDFVRQEGFDGWRYNINPSLAIPHHFQNYVSGEFGISMHQTFYQLGEDRFPGSEEIVTDDERQVFQFSYTASTALERVFTVADDSFLDYITSLGARSQANRLRRVKHVIEPFVRYNYTPSTYQDELPLFDSLDRIRQRSLVTYGVRTSLLGRFTPVSGATRIEELTPELEDIPVYDPDASRAFGMGLDRSLMRPRGHVNEVAYLAVAQSYDYVEDKKDRDPDRSSLSDLGYELGLSPTSYFGLALNGNFDSEEQDFSSWGLGTSFRDDRGDVLRARYSYIDEQISQVDGNLEVVLTERYRLGFFGRFDDRESEFIESEVALRIQSACNCWYVDVGYVDTLNPDRQRGMVRFTLLGLGDIAQNFSLNDRNTGTVN